MNTTKTSAGLNSFFSSQTLMSGVFAAVLALASWATPARATCSLTVSGTLTITGTVTADCVNVTSTGRIYISGGTLRLTGNASSVIDGCIILDSCSSVLSITDDQTFSGDGCIEGQCGSAAIEIASGKTLTSQITILGMLRIRPATGATGTTFVNDTGGLVRADAAGTLEICPDSVSGAGAWRVSSDSDAVLKFTTGSYCLTGPFDVQTGILDVVASTGDAGVCTSGNLSHTGGTIRVAGSKSFSAGGSCACEY